MNTKLYLYIAFRILILCIVSMAISFVPEQLRDFFGDTPFEPRYSNYLGETITKTGALDKHWNWGSRHYMYWWTMFLLFILSLIDSIISIRRLAIKYYPNLK